MINSYTKEAVHREGEPAFNKAKYLHNAKHIESDHNQTAKPVLNEKYVVREIKKRRDAEKLNKDYEKRLRGLLRQLKTIGKLQRESIASDLHDSAIQSLAGTLIKLGVLKKFICDVNSKELIDEIREDIDGTINDIRTLIFEIDSPVLEREGLLAALECLVSNIKNQNNLDISFFAPEVGDDLPEPLKTVAYRSVRELILNAVKHASASHISLSVQNRKDEWQFDIVDDGVGFDAGKISSYTEKGHFGLYYMIKRISHYNGTMNITSEIDKGTHISLTLPLQFEDRLNVNSQGIM